MMNVNIVLHGKTTWKDLKAEINLRHQGQKRKKTLCAELRNPVAGGFYVGEEGGFNQIYRDTSSLQTEKAFLLYGQSQTFW